MTYPPSLNPALKFRFVMTVATLVTATLLANTSRADNPIIQTLYTADPAPLVHEGTLYLYTTHDEDVTVNDFFTMNDWRVYSSTDAVNWTDHGSPLHYQDFNWAGGNAWAGQVIHRNGTFYFYVPVVRTNGANAIGVATSDSPFGPFEDAVGSPLVTSDCGDIDPTVWIDDDGQAYLYWGNPNLCYVKLNEDMISYQGDVVRVPMDTGSFGVRSNSERPTSYEEGPWFYKRSDLYYMVYPGGPLPEHIAYSTSTGPTGPWSYRGVIMPAQGGSFTNHPGVVDYKGKSLFFYHNGALPGGGGFKRSVCVEEFTYGTDGSIPQLQMTEEGASAVDVLNPFAQIEAETIAWHSGIETEVCTEGGMNVTDIDDGDFIKLKDVEFGSGASTFEMRVAATSDGSAVELRLDSNEGTLIGECTVAGTGGEQTWATQSCSVEGASGKHDLFLRFTGGGFKFNWWRFTGSGDPGMPGAGGQGGAAGSGGSVSAGGAGAMGGDQAVAGGGGNASGGTSPMVGAAGSTGLAGSGGLPDPVGSGVPPLPTVSSGETASPTTSAASSAAGSTSQGSTSAVPSPATTIVNPATSIENAAGAGGGAPMTTSNAASDSGACHFLGRASTSRSSAAMSVVGLLALVSLRRRKR